MTVVSHPEEGPSSEVTAKVSEPREPETASAASPGGRLTSPALQGGIAFLIYLVIFLTSGFRPILSHATQMLLEYKSQDPDLNVWILGWWPYALGHGLNPLYTHQIMAPAGTSLAWVTTIPPLALLAMPLTVVAGPVLSINLLAALGPPLTGWAAFVLCRRLTGKFWAGLAGGAVFGFSAYETSHAAYGQLNLTYTLLLPVLGYIIVVWWERRITTRTFVSLAAAIMAVQFYLFLELFADLTGILAISLIIGFALAGRAGRPMIVRLGKALGLAYLIAFVLALPYVLYMLSTKAPRPTPATGTDLASLVIPRPGRTFGITWLAQAAADPNKLSAACYIGIPLLVLVALLAVTSWQSRLVRFLCWMPVIIVIASLGSRLVLEGRSVGGLPWGGIFNLPLVRNAIPLRLMVFAYLVLAVATAVWLAGPAKRVRWARWPLAVLVIASIALDAAPVKLKAHNAVPEFITAGQYRSQLSPDEIVVVISKVGNAGMLWQARSDFYMRIAGGYINEGINHRTDLPRQVAALADPTPARVATFEKYISADHVGAILLDGNSEPGPWVGIFQKVGLVGHAIGGVVVYPTHGCSTCRTLDRAELAENAPGTA